MDRAAFFTDLTLRNALRKAAQLPLLDLRTEMIKAVALDNMDRYRAICETYAEDRQRIRDALLAERRVRFGDDWEPRGYFGHLGLETETDQRFRIFLEIEHGIKRPSLTSNSLARNP